ncbi:MAG: hypothetical protein LRY75_09115 [Shewanella xiamenensis]|uniref:Uncharacterized protein n=1 Tax=Shewanella xiamenensis TaxID=332186 RepID=A0AAE4PXX2_9GAMM|nr:MULTISPECIES: hypothetical protein [Shewanella]MCD8549939.1 hypothetical protein [Shewanella xiamenensis]MCD8558964.1 hypothetical protein [Shewanella xiamenensis]MDV5390631.1 hypothetical protein [Shewanella xiamenensis]
MRNHLNSHLFAWLVSRSIFAPSAMFSQIGYELTGYQATMWLLSAQGDKAERKPYKCI